MMYARSAHSMRGSVPPKMPPLRGEGGGGEGSAGGGGEAAVGRGGGAAGQAQSRRAAPRRLGGATHRTISSGSSACAMYKCMALSVSPCTSVVVPYGQCVTKRPSAMWLR